MAVHVINRDPTSHAAQALGCSRGFPAHFSLIHVNQAFENKAHRRLMDASHRSGMDWGIVMLSLREMSVKCVLLIAEGGREHLSPNISLYHAKPVWSITV